MSDGTWGPPPVLPPPRQFGPEFRLEDIWEAYRTGARETRSFAQRFPFQAGPSDHLIERACDAYVKLVVLARADAERREPAR